MSIPQGKEKFEFVYSYVLLKFKSWYNHGIKLETRMSFFIRSALFLSTTKVSLNYCVGVKEKRPNNLTEIKIKIPKLKSFNIKTNFRCCTNQIWESFPT